MEKTRNECPVRKARRSALVLMACVASLSGRAGSQVRLSDIVYANDQSGSMALNNIWISPDERDTVYLSGTTACQGLTNSDLNNFGSVTVLSEAGTRAVRRINPGKSVASCSEHSGDPFSQRALAFRRAIDFQAFHAPQSRAGYLGFSADLIEATPPLALDSPAAIASLKSRINIVHQGPTNYHVALSQAKRWLTNPALSPNPVKAVVFLSDGKPNQPDTTSYLDVLSSTYADAPGPMPPIHGIFMGDSNPDSARLHELSRLTGGLFFRVPPHRPDSLRAVMEHILGSILDLTPSTGSRKPRGALVPKGEATPTGFVRHSDGALLIPLDPNAVEPGGMASATRRMPGRGYRSRESAFADFLGRIRFAD